ncbi:MAG TPA: hypothetical protein VF406_09005 [Thermodesulfobacteriota bacterium]
MAPRWLGSFQARLVLAFALLITGIGTIGLLAVVRVYEARERAAFELSATSMASILAVSATNAVYDLRFDQLRILLEKVLQQPYVRYAYVYDRDGRILADGTWANPHFNAVPHDPTHRAAIRAEGPLVQYTRGDPAERMLDAAQPIVVAGDVRLGGVRLGLTTRPLREGVARVRRLALGS